MRSSNGSYLDRVDHLRGWAAMLVLVYHSMGDLTKGALHHVTNNPFYVWIIEGHTGVSMFLVLSGFILTIINHDALDSGGKIDYKGFIFNRFVRIFPLLIFVFFLAIAAKIATFSPKDILPLILLQLNTNESIGISSEWAVGIEFQCYLLFPFLLTFMHKSGIRYLVELVIFMICIRIGLQAAGHVDNNGAYYFSIVGRLDQFLIGMIAASVYLKYKVSPPKVWILSGLIVLGLLGQTALLMWGNYVGNGNATYGNGNIFPSVFHATEALFWAVVMVSYVLLPAKKIFLGSVWSKIGEISFSLYLLHTLITVAAINYVYPRFAPLVGFTSDRYVIAALITLVFVIPASLAMAWLGYRLIEKPFLQFRKPYMKAATPRP